MRFVFDSIIAALFWSFMTFSAVEVYRTVSEASVKQVHRGLSSTVKFTEALTRPVQK